MRYYELFENLENRILQYKKQLHNKLLNDINERYNKQFNKEYIEFCKKYDLSIRKYSEKDKNKDIQELNNDVEYYIDNLKNKIEYIKKYISDIISSNNIDINYEIDFSIKDYDINVFEIICGKIENENLSFFINCENDENNNEKFYLNTDIEFSDEIYSEFENLTTTQYELLYNFFMLINKIKHPELNLDKIIILYTARPKKDRHIYINNKIPVGIYLTSSIKEAEGYMEEFRDRDLYKVKIKRKNLVLTLDSEFDKIKNYIAISNEKFIPVNIEML